MNLIKVKNNSGKALKQSIEVGEDISEEDEIRFLKVISTDLSESQREVIKNPQNIFHRQAEVLAVHWHPEFIPMDLIEKRIHAMYPNRKEELVIPTQHNMLSSFREYTGVEVDCYSQGFQRKVQLLLHFKNLQEEKAGILKNILEHTFQYRASQLFEFIATFIKPVGSRLDAAAKKTGINKVLIQFVQQHIRKIDKLISEHHTSMPKSTLKNKLLRNYFDILRSEHGDEIINRVQMFLQAVKTQVKADFPLHYFYRTSAIIEEARALGAGIVIPHPEQFWPILLAEYDVDGYEVWNPQSLEYTEFLIQVLHEKNMRLGSSRRKLLVFMGDDTHMAEKIGQSSHQHKDKAVREIGYQPTWEVPEIIKKIIMANMSRHRVIKEYKERLNG